MKIDSSEFRILKKGRFLRGTLSWFLDSVLKADRILVPLSNRLSCEEHELLPVSGVTHIISYKLKSDNKLHDLRTC